MIKNKILYMFVKVICLLKVPSFRRGFFLSIAACGFGPGATVAVATGGGFTTCGF